MPAGIAPSASGRRADRHGARPEHGQLPAPLAAGRPGCLSGTSDLGLGLSRRRAGGLDRALRESVGPALSANRTMGSLGGWSPAGSRGSSGSAGRASRSRATRLRERRHSRSRSDWLRSGELDAAIVGAVDLAGDVRSVLATSRLGAIAMPGEGAAALVLKRLERRGSRRQSHLRGHHRRLCGHLSIDAPLDRDQETIEAALRQAYSDAGVPAEQRRVFSSAAAEIGAAGAASGLASVVKTALCLYQQIIPSRGKTERSSCSVWPPDTGCVIGPKALAGRASPHSVWAERAII